MASTAQLTPDALLEIPPPDDKTCYELSDGELVIVGRAGLKHEFVKSRIHKALNAWSADFPDTWVLSESLFALGVSTARIPDVAVLLPETVALLPNADVVLPVAPDVAVEVISASESAEDAELKVRQYLAAGVKEVWQVYQKGRFIRVRRPNSIEDIGNNEMFRSRVLVGFEIPVGRFFD